MSKKLVDLSLGLDHKAWAVAHLLADKELDIADCEFPWIQTAPWYNGRERGLVFSLSIDARKYQHIAVFEHRNTDNICALLWENDGYMNPPTMASDGDLAYGNDSSTIDIAFSVEWNEAGKMAEWVEVQMREFAERQAVTK